MMPLSIDDYMKQLKMSTWTLITFSAYSISDAPIFPIGDCLD